MHGSRTLIKLQHDGVITRNRRMITVVDWKNMMSEADFEPRYLHIREHAAAVKAEPAAVTSP